MSKFLRTVLFVFFSFYYILIIVTSSAYFSEKIGLMRLFGGAHFERVTPTIYVGTYPEGEIWEKIKQNKIRRIVSILNPIYPFSKELVAKERKLCKEKGIAFIDLPGVRIDDPALFSEFLALVSEEEMPTYIHAYRYGDTIRAISRVLRSRVGHSPQKKEKQSPGK
ncbi:hypothetical protein [Nitratifractor sp.]